MLQTYCTGLINNGLKMADEELNTRLDYVWIDGKVALTLREEDFIFAAERTLAQIDERFREALQATILVYLPGREYPLHSSNTVAESFTKDGTTRIYVARTRLSFKW